MGRTDELFESGATFKTASSRPFVGLADGATERGEIVRGIINKLAGNMDGLAGDINKSLEYDSRAYSLIMRAAPKRYSDVAGSDLGYTIVIEVLPRRFAYPAAAVPRNSR